MPRFLAVFGLLFALLTGAAYSTSITTTGAGFPASSSCSPSFTYEGDQFANTNGPFSFTGYTLGTPTSTRYVIAFVGTRGGTTVLSVTIDGISASVVVSATTGRGIAIVKDSSTSSGSGSVAFSVGGTQTSGIAAVYSVTCLNSATPVATVSGAPPQSLNADAGGVLIAGACSAANFTYTWSGVNKDFNQALTGGSCSAASISPASSGSTSVSYSGDTAVLIAASWD